MKAVIFWLLLTAALAPEAPTQKFVGTITDSMCAEGDHSRMRMGPTDAECVRACIDFHDATYVLFDGKDVYALSEQKTPERFAGKKVVVTGTLNAKSKTIQVELITAQE
jgi:hypothetical protein